MPCTNDINIKSECPDYEDEYDEQYYEEGETVSMDVVLADNNSVQSIQTDHSDNITIPTIMLFTLTR